MKTLTLFKVTVVLLLTPYFSVAAELLPLSIREVKTPGAAQIKLDGKSLTKVSSVFEYQYPEAKVESAVSKRDTLVLDLDQTTVGFSIVIYTEGRNYGYVYQLSSPQGQDLVSPLPKNINPELIARKDINGRGQLISANGLDFEVYKNISISPVPINDQIQITPGRWTFSIDVEELKPEQNNSFRVSVFVKKSSSPITSQTMGQIHLEAFSTLASKAPTDLNGMKNYLQNSPVLKKSGLNVVVHKYTALDPKFDSMCDDASRPCNQMLIDFRSTTQERTPGLLKAVFTRRNNFSNAGIANLQGSVSSLFAKTSDMFDGIFVWTDPDLNGAFENTRETFTHELGHHLGLYHTDKDQISDTKAFNHWIENNQQPTSDNVMTAAQAKGDFSPGQRYVILRSPVVELYTPTK